MNEEEIKRLKDAFARMNVADSLLQKVSGLLATFGTDVPSLNPEALKMIIELTNSIDKSIAFIKSFIRVSTLKQIVPKPLNTRKGIIKVRGREHEC